ncbi:MAG TPA: fumarylacetoacetase [Xanthobacteraceae bacterium]|jgi:fumarylacetoacetase|nr:fumarylacetoacetase [Xanthobacteraceae bacterium]
MTITLNETHDPARRSFVDSANEPGADFPIQNLPFGVFRVQGQQARVGVAIGDQIVDITAAGEAFSGPAAEAARACGAPYLNYLMSLGPQAWSELRLALSRGLSAQHGSAAIRSALIPQAEAEMMLPAAIPNFTDFFASVFHATNAGKMFRPDNPLMPNYKYVPVAYHSRASSIRVSGTPFKRPRGQRKPPNDPAPTYGPSRHLDFELELGFYVGTGSQLGHPVPVASAGSHIFGYCLLNDWSARDIQAWEYQPLGPFLGKNFATTVSPWVVTAEALAPYRTKALTRPEGDPAPLPYLDDADDRAEGGLDIALEVYMSTETMRRAGTEPLRITQTSASWLYWTMAQMLAHHTSNGCNLAIGDLMGTGTISGPEKANLGSLLEITMRGTEPMEMPGGEKRGFIEDGDEITFRGFCEKPGHARIGFGECRAVILPAD